MSTRSKSNRSGNTVATLKSIDGGREHLAEQFELMANMVTHIEMTCQMLQREINELGHRLDLAGYRKATKGQTTPGGL